MKLFYSKIGNRTVNINGQNVKFVDCMAEVEDDFGKEALEIGLPGLYEDGKQPVFETPKEVQMMSDFKDKEDFYQGEIARLKRINDAQKKKIEGLETELQNWKNEYLKEHDAFAKYVADRAAEAVNDPAPEPEPSPEEAPASPSNEAPADNAPKSQAPADDEAELRKELEAMTKADLIAFAVGECKMKEESLKGLKKGEILDKILEASAE